MCNWWIYQVLRHADNKRARKIVHYAALLVQRLDELYARVAPDVSGHQDQPTHKHERKRYAAAARLGSKGGVSLPQRGRPWLGYGCQVDPIESIPLLGGWGYDLSSMNPSSSESMRSFPR